MMKAGEKMEKEHLKLKILLSVPILQIKLRAEDTNY